MEQPSKDESFSLKAIGVAVSCFVFLFLPEIIWPTPMKAVDEDSSGSFWLFVREAYGVIALLGVPVLCGYVGARIAREREFYHAILIGILGPLCLFIILDLRAATSHSYSALLHFGPFPGWLLASVALAYLGAWIDRVLG